MERIPCRRCLLSEYDPQAYHETVEQYVRSLSDELRADPAVYTQRLAACRACDCLLDGMCRKCGCFVEVRAAKKALGCPHEQPRWTAQK
ncbi:MAG: hypothetical protein IJC25_01220 [Clostridia bacterium]|nr:hypothetical protein [Clostridia bacterium]